MILVKIFRFIATVKDLKLRQIFYFFLFYFKKKEFIYSPYIEHRARLVRKKPFFIPRYNAIDLKKKSFTFGFIKRKINLRSWIYSSPNLLWEYNLFYFDFIFSKNLLNKKKICLNIVHTWIDLSYKQKKHVMWDAYPTSLRLINFIKFCIFHNINSSKINSSIHNHVNHLKKNLEYRLDANHLLTNLIAINCGNEFLKVKDAKHKKFKEMLFCEINTQFKNDLHYEKTPSYHNLLTEKLIEFQIIKNYLCLKISKKEINLIKKLINTSKNFSHPDKYPAFFNDTNFDCINHEMLESLFLKNFKKEKIIYKTSNNNSFFSLKNKKFFLISKCCDPNPIFNPGHSHADSLSFELSLNNQRFIVNKGISTYSNIPQRYEERSTKSHNCLTVDNKNSSEIWSSFRVGEKSKIIDRNFNFLGKTIECSQESFKPFFKKLKHTRKWKLQANKIIIDDKINTNRHKFFLYFHFSPGTNVMLNKKNLVSFKTNKDDGFINFSHSQKIYVKRSFYYPNFGNKKKIKSLIVECNGDKNITEIIIKK